MSKSLAAQCFESEDLDMKLFTEVNRLLDCDIDERGVCHPIPALRGFMVCKRSVNNADGKNTRVDFLRTDTSLPWRWKKPFRECECMFGTMEAAIMAAADAEGISLQNASDQ